MYLVQGFRFNKYNFFILASSSGTTHIDSDDEPLSKKKKRLLNEAKLLTEINEESKNRFSPSSMECGSSDEYFPDGTSSSDSSDNDQANNRDNDQEKEMKSCRWRRSHQENWKKNLNKKRRSLGSAYISRKVQKSPKTPRVVNCQNCQFECSVKFSEDDRNLICSNYWQMSYMRQKDFILSCVETALPKCRRIRTGTGPKKLLSRKYFFKKKDVKLQVCKIFFLKTLHISHGPVDKALKGLNEIGIFGNPDKRGHHVPANKTSEDLVARVKLHIESFPTMESHYCRKSTKREYLDPSLSIAKMYELYVNECSENNEKYVSEITYRRIFGTNYNLAFFKPKKDQCAVCEKHTRNLVTDEEYQQHLRRRDEANYAKRNDKERATVDKAFLSASFDLQSVLRIPSSDVSQMYYAMKLCAYNLTIYSAAPPNDAYCFAWSELNGQRGSCEIGTALLNWIREIPNSVREISLFSDTCGGQNRNQNIAALFLYVSQNFHFDVIQHNFLEKGHSYMEVDSMHSAIERAKKNVAIYTMNDLLNIFKLARSKRLKNKRSGPYKVTELRHGDFFDLKGLSNSLIKNKTKDDDGNQVNWLHIKVMRYEKTKPGRIFFKYNYSDPEYRTLCIFGRGKPIDIPKKLTPLYKGLLPISEKKKASLMKLIASDDIPTEYHDWYKSLPVDKKKKNVVPEPTLSESDSE